MRRAKAAAAVMCAVLLSVPATAQSRKLKPGINLFSREQDIQLGKEAARQIEKQIRLTEHQEIQDYVERLGRRLASRPEADKYPYFFKVVDDREINAFALPGGPVYINAGVILAAENEAQLAGVMAHEISHVALRHGTNQVTKAHIVQLPALLAGLAIGSDSLLGQLGQLGVGIGANSLLLKFSRGAERDADLLGARLMSGAGYNPIEMARFFEKLESGRALRAPEFLSSHPNPGNRRRAVEQEIRYLPHREYPLYNEEFVRIQRLVQEVSAKQNLTRGERQGR
ncbi:MAG: M48 family metalloprotease [Bryobacteraceae bacterium]|jgi:predicted Zn-dependent protease|nr:M48 family metalloprotease [Bryobacteraceae bacterium]